MAKTDVVTRTQELVRIGSVNPMGRGLIGPTVGEGRLTDFLEDVFRGLGVAFERQEVVPGRENIVARVDVPGSINTVLFEVHQDTVPVDTMTEPPFEGAVRDGKVWGRGSCDVKGGMAAILCAIERLVSEKPKRAASVVMACTVDEEHTFSGIRRFLENPPGASMAVVSEPTRMEVVIAHKGLVRWKVRTQGRSCHSANPELGVNAIYRMAPVLEGLEAHSDALFVRDPHPLLGPPTLSVGVIRGGTSVNTVPGDCEIEIDRRINPGEDHLHAYEEARRCVLERVPDDSSVVFEAPWIIDPYLDTPPESPVVDVVCRAVDAVQGRHRVTGVSYGTDGSKIAQAGIPTVVFGPGDIAQAHTAAEWVEVEQLRIAAEVYYQIIRAAGGAIL